MGIRLLRSHWRSAICFQLGVAALAQTVYADTAQPVTTDVLAQLPLRFEANRSQPGSRTLYVSHGPGYSLTLTQDGSVLRLRDGTRTATVAAKLLHASAGADLSGVDALPVSTNYLRGNQPSAWVTGVSSYSRVRYPSVYPGIDLVFYGKGRNLEYDFIVSPDSNPSRIEFEISKTARLTVDVGGDLILATEAGDVRWRKPEVYQIADGRREAVPGAFVIRRGNRVGFEIGAYDRSRVLVIDPTLSYSTFLGGGGNDAVKAITLDTAGNIYLVGTTDSMNLPFTAGSFQPAFKGGSMSFSITGDTFVTKIDPTGTKVIYNTYLGGSRDDIGLAIAVDAAGSAYVAGYTNSLDFPIKNALQPAYGGPTTGSSGTPNFYFPGGDAFVTKLNPAGNALVYSTYLGGSSDERVAAIAVDSSGNAYVAGTTLSTNFPVSATAFQKVMKGGGGNPEFCTGCGPVVVTGDAFVVKIAPDGSKLVYSTLIGGHLDDAPYWLLVDPDGSVCVAGATLSPDFPTTAGAYQSSYHGTNSDQNQILHKLGDAFIAELSPDGSKLNYSTYFGGKGDEIIGGMAMDASDNLYVTGLTSSSDFPTTQGPKYHGPASLLSPRTFLAGDVFVAKFNFSVKPALIFSTLVGGSDDDGGAAIALDKSGNILLTGFTVSADFPVTADAFQKTFGGTAGGQHPNIHSFFMKMDPTGTNVLYSTLLGGAQNDVSLGLVLDAAGNALVAGSTSSSDFPIKGAALQKTFGGGTDSNGPIGDAFLAKITGLSSGSAPAISSGGIVNGGTFLAGSSIGPGGFVSIFGSDLASTGAQGVGAPSIPLPATLSNVGVTINGEAAPIYFVSPLQINVQAPWDLDTTKPAAVIVTNNGVSSAAANVSTASVSPAVLAFNGHAIAINLDGTLAAPAGSIAGLTTHPIKRGGVIQIYATGLGPVNPAVPTGGVPPSGVLAHTATTPTVLVGNVPAGVLFSGLTPQFVGVNQVNITVPDNAPTGASVPLQIRMGSSTSPATVTIAVDQ